MLFTSVGFIAFIAVLFILYYILPKKLQPWLLLLFSLAFYVSYSISNLPFIAVTVLSTWGGARLISRVYGDADKFIEENRETLSRDDKKARKNAAKRRAKVILTLCLFFNFGILAFFKYVKLINGALNAVDSLIHGADAAGTDLFLSLALPLGISFYTFMCMGYMIDVYRGKYAAERNILRVALFASYFPQLVQGPFSHFDELGETLFAPHSFDGGSFSSAVLRIAWGYFKKLVLADRVVIALNALIGAPDVYRGAYVLAAVILYSLRIYADFTGGIDITIGISEALGIKLKENFIEPYFSRSIAEYWRRWHITLGEWFREYLFYPLSIAKPITKLSKKLRKTKYGAGIAKRLPVYTATIVTWFVTGIWHGAAWNFIAWGMANCIVILISEELSPLYEKFHSKTGLGDTGAYGAFMALRTYILMSFIRMFDCYASVGTTFSAVGSIFTTANYHVLFDGSMLSLAASPDVTPLAMADYIVLAVGALALFIVSVLNTKKRVRERLMPHPWLRFGMTAALAIITLVFGVYGIGYDATGFIYTI